MIGWISPWACGAILAAVVVFFGLPDWRRFCALLRKASRFPRQKRPAFARLQISQSQRADRDPPQLQHFVPNARQQPAYFAVAPFVQHDFQNST